MNNRIVGSQWQRHNWSATEINIPAFRLFFSSIIRSTFTFHSVQQNGTNIWNHPWPRSDLLVQGSKETLLKSVECSPNLVECSPKGHKIFISSKLCLPALSTISIFFSVLHLKRRLINLDSGNLLHWRAIIQIFHWRRARCKDW